MTGGSGEHLLHALRFNDIAKSFRGTKALDGFNLTVPHGTVLALLGPNGAGKSTSLRCATGLARPSAGSCHVLGVPVARLSEVSGKVGVVFEDSRFHPFLTGRQTVRQVATMSGIDETAIEPALERVGLSAHADKRVRVYSQGMRRRLGIARAIVKDPQLLILDEPMNGLDPDGVALVRDIIRDLKRAGRTVVLATHLLSEAEEICDSAAIVKNGRCVLVQDLVQPSARATFRIEHDSPKVVLDTLRAAGIEAWIEGAAVTAIADDGAQLTEVLARSSIFPRELRRERFDLKALFAKVVGE